MGLGLKNRMSVQVTAVSNEFIDTYMAAANGEYVKVFLYLLRHEDGELTVSSIADALNHTESDVKRALSYWRDAGILEKEDEIPEDGNRAPKEKTEAAERLSRVSAPQTFGEELAAARTDDTTSLLEVPEPGNTYERLERLSEDEEFSALLYAVQQYLGKTFTQIECEKFAFFYDGLKMSSELLEYLAEYCAGGGHTSIRYIEKVAINWYQMGIKTKEEARNFSMRYSRDMQAVMKAFGITNRNPATAEQEYMKRWFKEYGFDSALVTEACSRTIKATGAASFPYADKILSGWKECGVKALRDVEELDKKRQLAKKQAQTQNRGKETAKKSTGTNRFKNFEERSYNYEDYVWEGMRKRQKKGGTGDGTQ